MALFPVIDLHGGPFERGRQHGERARARVERSLANYRDLFEFAGVGWRDAQAIARRFREPIASLDPALLEEIEGIAAGAGRPVEEILALNARTEILPPTFPAKADPKWLAQLKGADFGECTAIVVLPGRSATGGTLLAQNWDWLGSQRDALVLLRATDGQGGSLLTLTEAGMLAKIGLNSRGVGVCLNILRSRADGLEPGAPVHAVLRRILSCASVAEAEALVKRHRHGASSNIVCADAAGYAASFELSPAGVGVVREQGGVLCHTNHFLAATEQGTVVAPPPSLSSEPRLARAQALAAARATHGVAELQQILRDETDGLLSICRHPDPSLPEFARVESVASTVMELARGVMHVAPDVPSRADYVPVPLEAEAVVQ
jgi:isopenicillin-N N-acyltransferase-like protein